MKELKKQCQSFCSRKTTLILCLTLALFFPKTAFAAGNSSRAGHIAEQQQANTVKGTVVDESGEPLMSVTVKVKGTGTGTITDINGNFTLSCSKGATLQFTYMGYKTQEVKVTGATLSVTMKEDQASLDEVVVVGYGVQKKRDITGSITSVGEKSIEAKQPTDIFQALLGEAAGLQMNNTSGAPGAVGTILIRGASTMGSGVTPLYIVDGMTVEDISNINPSDVQSMEVLKDAASAAIYGSRSAAGVIIITTKKGQEGAPPRINVKYNHSFKVLNHKLDQANAFDRYIFERKSNAATSLWKTSNDSLSFTFAADNDYQDLITRTANSDQIDVNISGSKNKMNYYTSLGFLNDQGIVINSFFKRLTARTNVDFQATDHLKLMTKFNISYTHKNNINEGHVLQQAMKRPPQMTLYFPDGSYLYNNGGQFNPIADAMLRTNETTIYGAQVYQGVEWNFLKDFIWNANVQANYSVRRTDALQPGKLVSSGLSQGNNEAFLSRKLAAETYLSWAHEYNQHSLSAMAGFSIEDWRTEDFNLEGSNYVSESIITSNAQQVKDLTETVTEYSDHSMAAAFGRFSYSYAGRYLFNTNLRYDGSSRFIDKRWGLFPSASAGWRFSDEPFLKWTKPFLTDGKFRISWGKTGNERVGNYDALNRYLIGAYYNGVLGVYQNSRLANIGLGWESTEQSNIGLDLTFLDGRISFVAEYYVKNTNDLLSVENMPSELGVKDMRINFGKIQNKGIELTLSAYPVKTKDFEWQTTVNYTYNKNKVAKLYDGAAYVEDGKYWIEEGSPLGQWYGWKHLGIYQYDESNAYVVNSDGSFGERLIPVFETDPNNFGNIIYGSNGKPTFSHYETADGQTYNGTVGKMTTYGSVLKGGDEIWEDLDKDGVIGDADRQILGNGIPNWYIGWTNYLTYKNVSLSFSFYGSFGNKIYNKQRRELMTYSSSNATPYSSDIYKVWKYQGQISPSYSGAKATTGVQNARELSSYFLEDGDYIKLTNIRLTYNFDRKLLQKIHLKKLQAYVYGNNLLTWTNYTGYDPSSISNNNVLRPGQDNGRYPTAKEIGLGLNLNF